MAAVAPEELIFLDETSTPVTLTPLRARAPRGQRAVGRIPRGRRPHISWLATLTPAGIGESVLVEGAVDRPAFVRFVADVLAPTLRPGQVVVWDNLNVHKSTKARQAVEAAGCRVVFLPSYSPDFNPIEHAFAKAKQALRRAGPRSWEAVVAAVGDALATVTPADARAFFAEAGFPLPDHDTT
jgi:transposase